MKKDITNRKDIILLVDSFYSKVKDDNLIGPYFTEVIDLDWKKHLNAMYNFWENMVFHTGKYEGNPMAKHQAVHSKKALRMEHFTRWQSLFNETVNEYFKGKNADFIKQKALSIGTVMQVKLFR
jgi:hemoglobin